MIDIKKCENSLLQLSKYVPHNSQDNEHIEYLSYLIKDYQMLELRYVKLLVKDFKEKRKKKRLWIIGK